MKIISFIIPVYKVEKYIRKCLNSIYIQNVPEDNFEVIVINDGTPDNSMEIVYDFSRKHNNIKIIEQQNQGLSVARNKGLEVATGEYIWFVDSDDYLIDNSIKDLIEIILQRKVDIIVTPLNHVKEVSGETVIEKYPETLCMEKGQEIMVGKDYLFNNGDQAPMQRFIMRRNFLVYHQLKFIPGIFHEDSEYGPRLLYLADSVFLKKNPVYNYLLRSTGSIMATLSVKNLEHIILIFDSLMAFCEQKVEKKDKLKFKAKAYHILLLSITYGKPFWNTKEFKNFYFKNKSVIKINAWALKGDFDYNLKNVCYMLCYRFAPLSCCKFRQFLSGMHKINN
jgi:glycosyltransferase involved in cell wall biosynthesis